MPHTCLPRTSAPYSCVQVRVFRPVDRWGVPIGGTWTATCVPCGLSTSGYATAGEACDAGREHTEAHERNAR